MNHSSETLTTTESWITRLRSSMRVNFTILRTCIDERLTYRGDFIFSTFVRFLPMVTQIFLWAAIYKVGQPGNQQLINNYSYHDMVAYYLLTMVSRAFSSMPGLSSGIASDIREGSIKKYLTQPIDYLNYLFWYRVAHKIVYYIVAIGPYALIFYICSGYFKHQPTGLEWMMFLLTLIGSFFVGFLIEALLGLLAFWFLEVSSLIFIYMMLNYFLSGHMIPLDWLPSWLGDIIFFLPFKYLAYTPAAIILGKLTPGEMWLELTTMLLWIFGLLVANNVAYRLGVERYSAYGG